MLYNFRMDNYELAETFDRIADLMEIKGEVVYKFLAYRRAAENLRSLAESAQAMREQNRLQEIPGVGKAIAEKITELLDTGKLEFLERLEQEVPPTLRDLLQVPDLGPKKAALFWKQAGITTLGELEAAAQGGQLRGLPGMGEKSETRILEGIQAVKRRSTRMLLSTARGVANRWLAWLREQPGVERAEAAGSLRRWKATIGDIDLVAACTRPAEVMAAFAAAPGILRVVGQGENKCSVELPDGIRMQLWLQPPERFGSLLQFVSGSKDHNVRLRELAQRKGLSLSERGFIEESTGREILCAREEEVYATLGLPYIVPELREDRGEIQAAQAGRLPRLIEIADITADLHSHSDWSDGANTILQMAEAARAQGRKALAITDHTGSLGIANGLTVERLRAQRKAIDEAQAVLGDSIRLLQGAEVEIHADGGMDYPDEVLAELDIVIASLHVSLRQPREVITPRLLGVMRNPHVDIIGHLSGRLLPNREGADLDMDIVLSAARETGVALEINANPTRLDLDEVYARRAGEMGILMSINTDAHDKTWFEQAEYGVSVARRAWLSPENIITAWSPEKLLGWLAERNERAKK